MYDTRTQDNGSVRRRRTCLSCSHRFATIETLNFDQPLGTRLKRPEAPKAPRAPKPPKPRSSLATRPPPKEEEVGLGYDEDLEEVAPFLDIPRGSHED